MRKTILTIAAISIATVSVFSQSVTETRQIKTTALQMYEHYQVVMSGLYSKSPYTEDNFMALFERNALIYNDIVPDNHPQKLSPTDYFKKFQASINRIYPAFGDFKMGEPVSVGNKWQIKCHFTRETRFRTQKEMKYPEWTFHYTMTIEMDQSYHITNKVYENARIVSVEVDNPLKGFFIIENKENIPLLDKSGKMIEDWDEEYQSRIFPEDKWKIHHISVLESGNDGNIFEFAKGTFSKDRTDANFYQLDVQKLKKDIFGIGVNYSPSVGNKMSEANADRLKGIKQTSNAFSLSIFYDKQIFHKEKSTVFANIGLDFNKYSHEYSSTDIIHQRIDSVIDIHGDVYSRKIRIDSLNEKINITSVSVPLSVQYLHQLTAQAKNPIFLSCEFGVFAEVALSAKSEYDLKADYSGVYGEKYFNVELTHYYDYGNFKVNKGKGELNPRFNGGIFGGIGLWYALDKSNLLKFNVSYKLCFNPPLKHNEDYVIAKSNTETQQLSPKDYEPYQSLLHSTDQGLRNIGIGISWVKTIGK